MDMQESARHLAVLESGFMRPRPKALLDLAKKMGIEEKTVMTPTGKAFPATQYCVQLYCTADSIEKQHKLLDLAYGEQMQKEEFQNAMSDAFQIVCLMLTMERMRTSFWSFGSELRYQISAAGIRITRTEMNAFLAQQGYFSSKGINPNKGGLMEKNPVAVAIYAADLFTVCGTLHGNLLPNVEMPQELAAKYEICCEEEYYKDFLEVMLNTFCPAFIGQEAPKVKNWNDFVEFLASSDFYTAPASTKYHSNFPGGLTYHCCLLLSRLVIIVKPQTEAELGKLVLLAVGHDLCKVNVYKPYFTNEKIDGPAKRLDNAGNMQIDKYQTKTWANGDQYHYEERMKYAFEDKIPQGHGQKSLNMLLGYLPLSVTEDMAAAIDGHMRDYDNNPYCDVQMTQYPLCQYLHVADVIASMMDE